MEKNLFPIGEVSKLFHISVSSCGTMRILDF